MSLADKLAERRRRKRKTGKAMQRFRVGHRWARFRKARKRRLAQIAAIAKLQELIRQRRTWPRRIVFSEFLYHSPPHLHIASPERDKLIRICKIAERRGIRVGEFPPFDVVECVHIDGSWHYRDSGSPHEPRSCAGRGDGLAADLNDADGGSDKELAFKAELEARYL